MAAEGIRDVGQRKNGYDSNCDINHGPPPGRRRSGVHDVRIGECFISDRMNTRPSKR